MNRAQRVTEAVKTQVLTLGALLAIMWIVEVLDQAIFGQRLDTYGIRPRSVDGLKGILFSPFLHGGFPHLVANTVPFAVLGWFVLIGSGRAFWGVTAAIVLLSGLGTWLIGGANSIHVGASGVIFGYLGFLLLRAFFERSLGSILIAVIVGVLYGGFVWGLLPGEQGVSWEGHLCGFVAGGLVARPMARPRRTPEES